MATPRPDDGTLLYLSRGDVEAAGIGPAELIPAIEQAFAALAAGSSVPRARVGSKGRVQIGTGNFFQSLTGTLDESRLAGTKWFGVSPDNPARGLPNVSALIALNDLETGLPVAVMDGNWITGARTAAVSAAGAKWLAIAEASTCAFIGCGVQARSHALYLRHVRPGLKRASVLGRGAASRDAFIGWLRDEGWEVRLAADADDVLAGAEIVVSTVPEYAGWRAFLDPARLEPGALGIGVDLGRSWLPSGYAAFDLVATDDAAESQGLVAQGRLKAPAEFGADLGAMLTGRRPGRSGAEDRIWFVFAGHVLGDLAAAAAVYRVATERGLGTRLPR
jgi:ornithine cyclodeaminase/alanine dehydrogenase-like protein (mu-crystallin family)